MKITTSFIFLLFTKSTSFAPIASFKQRPTNVLIRSTEVDVPSDVENEGTSLSSKQLSVSPLTLRNELLQKAKSLVEESPTGLFITKPSSMDEFIQAASRLEAITPSMTENEKDLLVGDWQLVATSRRLKIAKMNNVKSDDDNKKKKNPFSSLNVPKLNDNIRNSITVIQRIRAMSSSSSDGIDRIDNIIQYKPLNNLLDIIPESSPLNFIRNVNVNPLDVTQTKVTLVHKAEVESVEPTLRSKLGLQSVVLSLAGNNEKIEFLDKDGADVFGLNVPNLPGLDEFANGAGSFDTTYIDANVRVSRVTFDFLDEVRVFVRESVDIDTLMSMDDEEVVMEISDDEEVVMETLDDEEVVMETLEDEEVVMETSDEEEVIMDMETPDDETTEVAIEEEDEDSDVMDEDDSESSTEVSMENEDVVKGSDEEPEEEESKTDQTEKE